MSNPDSLEGMKDSDLVATARKLLDATIRSTKILDSEEMDKNRLAEAQTVLGFLKATISATNTKVAIFKMSGLGDKIAAVERRNHRPHKEIE